MSDKGKIRSEDLRVSEARVFADRREEGLPLSLNYYCKGKELSFHEELLNENPSAYAPLEFSL